METLKATSTTSCHDNAETIKHFFIMNTTTPPPTTNFRKQFTANLCSNLVLFFVNILIGIWLVPYYIKNLGVGAYGLIPLAASLTQYVSLFTMALSGGTSRFLTIDLQQGNLDQANRTFNTAFWGLAGISLMLVPFLVALSFYAPVLFNVPPDQVRDSRWLFAGVSITFLFTTVFATLEVSTYAFNRLDCRNLIHFSNVSVRTGLLVLFFYFFPPSLAIVALSMLIGAIFATVISWHFWEKFTPTLRLSMNFFDRSRLSDLVGMGGWMVVNQIGTLLFLQIDLIVVNKLFGPVSGGEYASILQWNTLIRSMAGVLSGVLGPMLLIRYAQNLHREVERISSLSVKLLGLALALPVGLICGFSKSLLTLWLGPEFAELSVLMQIMLLPLVINLSVLPLFNINICHNKIRLPGIVTLGMGVLNLLLALTLASFKPLGFYGVALAGGVVLTLKNALFTPWYAAKIQGLNSSRYFSEILPGMVMLFAVAVPASFVERAILFSEWRSLIAVGTAVSSIYCLATWRFILKGHEKETLRSLMARNR